MGIRNTDRTADPSTPLENCNYKHSSSRSVPGGIEFLRNPSPRMKACATTERPGSMAVLAIGYPLEVDIAETFQKRFVKETRKWTKSLLLSTSRASRVQIGQGRSLCVDAVKEVAVNLDCY